MRAILFLLAAAVVSAAAAPLSPANLRCEYRKDPIGIDALQPRLSWTLESSVRGQRQAAYQILVSSSAALLAEEKGDVWNSGKVSSSQMNQITLAGVTLRSAARYHWTVRVWDRDGKASAYSAPAEWTMGLLRPEDWRARWIGWKAEPGSKDPMPVFRKQFPIRKPVRRALVFVTGLGQFELHLNGSKVGENVLDPGWTNYRKSVLYVTHDVTRQLRSGDNALGVMLGNGMYNVVGGRYVKFKGSFGPPKLILQLHVEFTDGTTEEIVSDGSWKTTAGPIVFSCTYGGEDYDARKELPGWDQPAFDDSLWAAALETNSPGGALVAQFAPPIRVMHTYQTVRVSRPAPGVAVYDLGQNFSGWPKLTVRGAAGTSVKMIPGELLDPKGLVTQRSSGRGNSFSYTLRGQGTETWTPRFSYYGFRYVQVETAVDPTAIRLEGQFTYSSAPVSGSFESSDPLLNRIDKLIHAAIRSNMQSVLTDCPHREKLGWLEESHLLAASLFYGYDLPSLYTKVLRDTAEAQTESGLIPDIAPEYVVFKDGFRDSPEWGSAAVILPWMLYQWYGDMSMMSKYYSVMARYVDYLDAHSENGIVAQGLGDWYDIGPGGPGVSKLTPKGVTGTAIQYQNLRILEKIAGLLSRPGDAEGYAKRAAAVRDLFQRTFYHPDTHQYATGSQTANAMALALGLAPETDRAAILDNLVADIRARDNHTSAGDIGYHYVVRALTEGGRSDVLFAMATRTDAPSYGYQLDKGATSLTEAWDANPNSSQNHFMLGHIEEWFYAGLAGISPDPSAVGFDKILIQPNLVGGVTSASASYDSIRGRIISSWKRSGDRFTLHVHVPVGANATVFVPGSAAETKEGVKPAGQVEGVKLLREENGAAVFAVESGDYEFSSPSIG